MQKKQSQNKKDSLEELTRRLPQLSLQVNTLRLIWLKIFMDHELRGILQGKGQQVGRKIMKHERWEERKERGRERVRKQERNLGTLM